MRGQNLAVHEALHRSLTHTSYRVGQIVYLARSICGDKWQYLSIPPSGSAAYNTNPSLEKPGEHETGCAADQRSKASTKRPAPEEMVCLH